MFFGRFLIMVSISVLVTGLFIFSFCFFLVQSRGTVPFQEFVHFFQIVHFIGIQLFIVSFHFYFYWFEFSPFVVCVCVCVCVFLMNLAKGLSILFIFSENQLLVSLIFLIVFFVSISIISALTFTIFFLLLTLSFVCFSLSSCFRCKVRLFIWDFSCFFR